MVNYISQNYFERIEELLIDAKDDILTSKASNLNILFRLLSALPLSTNIEEQEIKKYAKGIFGNKVYTSFKDRIISNAIKNHRLDICKTPENVGNHSAFYFFNNEEGTQISYSSGVAIKDRTYDGLDFFDNCTVANLPIETDWQVIADSIPPCNAMLIIDKYIFGHPFEEKLSSLKSFIEIYKADIEIKFHLTIIFSQENNRTTICTPAQIETAFNELRSINGVELQLFSDNNIPTRDRLFFTNYCSGNIGHPFDGGLTQFNQHFLGREQREDKIRRNYKTYKKNLSFWYSFIQKIPEKIGEIRTKWVSSDFTNRLFEPTI
jgi:hypothetical protein